MGAACFRSVNLRLTRRRCGLAARSEEFVGFAIAPDLDNPTRGAAPDVEADGPRAAFEPTMEGILRDADTDAENAERFQSSPLGTEVSQRTHHFERQGLKALGMALAQPLEGGTIELWFGAGADIVAKHLP